LPSRCTRPRRYSVGLVETHLFMHGRFNLKSEAMWTKLPGVALHLCAASSWLAYIAWWLLADRHGPGTASVRGHIRGNVQVSWGNYAMRGFNHEEIVVVLLPDAYPSAFAIAIDAGTVVWRERQSFTVRTRSSFRWFAHGRWRETLASDDVFVDDFDDLRAVNELSKGVFLEKKNANMFGGDASRLVRSSLLEANATWVMTNPPASCEVTAWHHSEPSAIDSFRFTSADDQVLASNCTCHHPNQCVLYSNCTCHHPNHCMTVYDSVCTV
jgi:hypothetical protein